MTEPIVVAIGKAEIVLISPYEAKDLIRTIPGRRWDKTRKVWTAPATALDVVLDVLDDWPGGVRCKARHTPGTGPSTASGSWPDQMFDQVPDELHGALYRALAKVLHPDLGGDTTQMQALTTSWARHQEHE